MIEIPVDVKEALKNGNVRKEYKIEVLDDNGAVTDTINNDYLVSESVKIDERMCSGRNIEFGLCEGSSLEFQYFNKPSILGKEIKASIVVKMQRGTQVAGTLTQDNLTVTCNLIGSYFMIVPPGTIPMNLKHMRGSSVLESLIIISSLREMRYDFTDVKKGDTIVVEPSVSGSFSLDLQVVYSEANDTIPMGYFTVDEISRQASTGIMKATCYNKLRSDFLDAKANQSIVDYLASITGRKASVFQLLKHLLGEFKIRNNRGEPIPATISLSADDYYLDALNATFWKTCWQVYILKITVTPEDYSASKSYSYQIPSEGLTEAIRQVYNTTGDINTEGVYVAGQGGIYHAVTFYNMLYNPEYLFSADKTYFRELLYFTGYTNVGPTKNVYLENMTESQISQFIENNIQIIAHGNESSFTTDVTSDPLIISIPVFVYGQEDSGAPHTWRADQSELQGYYNNVVAPTGGFGAEIVANSPLDSYEITLAQAEAFSDITLRELQSADYEAGCLFGQLDRQQDGFYGVELNHSRLYPSETIYPENTLYPDGGDISAMRAIYSKLWADEGNVQSFKDLIITYKGLDEEQREKDFTLQRTVNADGTQNYNCSDNWLFRNLVWTAEQIGAYADIMVGKMRDVKWFPFEMWSVGLPYIETGDEIEIPIGQETYTSYILQRTLSGIQNLQDTYINGELDIF